MTLTRDDLLVLLIEECAEITQAATKCLRFGFTRETRAYGRNDLELSKEIGEALGVVMAIEGLDWARIAEAQATKVARATEWKAKAAAMEDPT